MNSIESIPMNRLKALRDASDDEILNAYFFLLESNSEMKKQVVDAVRHQIGEEIWKRKIQ